jgi:hypothetical protein
MGVFNLCCPGSDRIEVVKTWMDAMAPDGNRIYIGMTSADQRQLAFLIDRSLLERSAVFKFLRSFKAVMAGRSGASTKAAISAHGYGKSAPAGDQVLSERFLKDLLVAGCRL